MKLPFELQYKISNYIKQEVYFIKNLQNVLSKKFTNFNNKIFSLYYDNNNFNLEHNLVYFMFSNTDNFIKISELYKKYYEIISNDNKINNDIHQSRKLIFRKLQIYENYIYNANSSHIFDVCWAAYLKFDANINPNTKLSSAS